MKKRLSEVEGAKEYKEANNWGLEGNEESYGGLDRYSVQKDGNLPEHNQKQESIRVGTGPNFRETG